MKKGFQEVPNETKEREEGMEVKKTAGILIVISGPSGVGKGAVVRALKELDPNILESVSVTTRKKRPGETEGVHYFFKTIEEYGSLKKDGRFLETFEVIGNYYGTLKEFVFENLNSGTDVLLEIDIQGALDVKKNYQDAVLIFLAPPSMKELERRLRMRDTEDEKTIIYRLKNATSELQKMNKYDYVVINDNILECANETFGIIQAERKAAKRNKEIMEQLLKN
ncbi:MAG: guanylate kinase [Firmicutes bacterium]|nr:guanylate kinase [Bacillota bacterium]